MATDFQKEVMFWQGEGIQVDEQIKALAQSAEMDEVVKDICRMLGDAKACGERDGNVVAFKVWRNGLCFDISGSYYDSRLGASPNLSAMLYGSHETLRALQYRGVLEGFKILRHASSRGASCTSLKSYVIMFISPDG